GNCERQGLPLIIRNSSVPRILVICVHTRQDDKIGIKPFFPTNLTVWTSFPHLNTSANATCKLMCLDLIPSDFGNTVGLPRPHGHNEHWEANILWPQALDLIHIVLPLVVTRLPSPAWGRKDLSNVKVFPFSGSGDINLRSLVHTVFPRLFVAVMMWFTN